MTFSIVARCQTTGMFGVALTSSSPAVAARCSYARPGVGAVATQNITDPSLGHRAINLMIAHADAQETLRTLKATDSFMSYRQLLIIDKNGNTAMHSGDKTLGVWNEISGMNAVAAGNLLANPSIPGAIVAAFEKSEDSGTHLGDRLLDALRAGLNAGGEAGPIHSAGLKIVAKVSWPIADLRVDWTDGCPITELESLWQRYRPQMDDYVARAINPAAAPSYGVPGDE